MLFSIFSAALFAGLTVAQYAGLPSCAEDCASDQFSGGSYGDCGTDPKCICSDGDFLDTIACCLVGACDAADQTSAISFAQQICQANGVSVPSTATCATATAGSASATATGTLASTSATATGSGTAADTDTATATGTARSTSASAAWAPRQTAAGGVGLLGGLAAAGLVLL